LSAAGWRAAGSLALLLALAGRASAHGEPPAATELLARDERGALLVRLTRGFAQRGPSGFRFLCPEAWDGNLLAPAAALASGPVVVASRAVFLLEPDGNVSLHPVQSGSGLAVASHGEEVFGIFEHEGQRELRRVTRGTNELVRILEQPARALAVSADELAVLRWLDRTLVVDRLSLEGEPRGSVTWTAASTVADAHLRMAAGQLYVVVEASAAPWVTLGRINGRVDASYAPLLEASISIDGPVALAAGTMVTADGNLRSLDSGAVLAPLADRLNCLGDAAGAPYACAQGDLFELNDGGLGAPLFALSSVQAPGYDALSGDALASCGTRWLDFRTDVSLAESARAPADGGLPDAAASQPQPTPSPAGASEGCSAQGRGPHSPWSASLVVLSLTIAARRPRRRVQAT
jgi:hypothetical protein